MNFPKVTKLASPLGRVLASLALVAFAGLPARVDAQCTASTPLAFEPNPPGVSRPGTLSSGFSTSLALYRNSAGAPRMLMFEAWGYSTLDLTNPGVPLAVKYDDLRLDPITATTNQVRANGDGQSYIQTVGVSADGQRIISSVNGPAEPTWHNLVGRSDGAEGFGMWGDFGDSRASGTVIVQNGARYIAFATYFTNPLVVSDVTTLTTVNANFQSLNLASEATGLPPGYALSSTGNFVVYTQTSGGGIQIIDASAAGPAGNILSGLRMTTLASVPGDPYARVPKNFAAAVDPVDPTKLWVLVELAASTANGENSPSYALVSISKDGNGNFQAPVPAGSVFRVPSQAGENWGMSGGSASLVVSQGQLFAIMWATRQTPTQQFALYTSSTTWAPTGGVVTTPQGFGLAATSAGALAGAVNNVYQYLPAGPKAWVVPMSCTPVNAPAVSTLTVTNASAGGAPVADGGTVFFGEQLTFVPNVVPSPLSKPLTFWSFDYDFHVGNGTEDNGALPRVKNSDMNQATNGVAPPATVTLIGPCDPRANGSPSSGLGCWASVQGNAAAGGPDYASATPAPGSTAPLKVALEAANQFGQSNTAVFTVNWKVPVARVASSQILSGQPLVSASDGHPSSFKWWFGPAANNLTVNASCTTAACTPPGGTNFYWVTATYLNGYSTADYDGTTVVGLPFTVTSFVPVFTVNGVATGPITAYTFQTLLIQNNSQRGTGVTANYQYYACQAPCADNDSGYVTFPLPDVAGGSTTIPVPASPGSWALRIKANNSGPNTPARWPDPATAPAGFPLTVSNAPPPINVTASASPNPSNPGQAVQLSCSATGGTGSGYTYEWSGTVGGPFSTQSSFAFTASNSTSADVTTPYYCTVHDSAGGSGINNVNVTVHKGAFSPLNVSAFASPNPASPGNQVTLSCSASGGTGTGYQYSWSGIVGGPFSNSPTFTFTASNSTTTPVTTPYYCTVTDSSSASGQATVPLTVYGSAGPPGPACSTVDYSLRDYSSNQVIAPVGAGQFSAYQVSVGQVIQFIPSNTTFSTYDWTFGDGSTSALPSPQHAFQTGGTRSVILTASGNNACTTPTSYTVIVSGPTGNFSAGYEDSTTITYTNVAAFKNIVFSAYDAPGAVDLYSWDFGDGSAHANGQTVTHGFAPGSWTVTLAVTKGVANVTQTLALTVIPPPEPPKWVVPGMASLTSQLTGAHWQSDVAILNPHPTLAATYSVAFLDANAPYAALNWKQLTIPPLNSLASPNLLGDFFGQPDGAYGALMVRGDAAPLPPVITARTVNNGDAVKGTFGLSVPQMSVSGGVSSQASPAASVLIGLRQNASAYTNLGLVNLKNDSAKVQLDFFDGVSVAHLGQRVVDLAPYQALQISRALLDAGYAGTSDLFAVTVKILEGTAVYPYATVIDVNSTDPIVVTPTETPSNSYRVPGIIRLTGAKGEKWRSRVTVTNPAGTSRKVHISFSYVACNENGCSNLNSTQGDVFMAPGQTQSWDDFVKVWLTVKGFIPVDDGTRYLNSFLDVSPAAGDPVQDPVIVLGETYNDTPTGHVGLQIPGYTPQDAASRTGAYKRLALTGLSSSSAYRTNLALFAASGSPGAKWISVHLYLPDGTKLRDLPVQVDGFTQIDNGTLFGGLSGDLSRVSVVVDNIDDGVSIGGYATVIDNTSGDSTFVKGTPVP